MANVGTYYINGIKCNIDDSAYRDKTPEELAVIRRNAENIARQIFRNAEIRAREEARRQAEAVNE